MPLLGGALAACTCIEARSRHAGSSQALTCVNGFGHCTGLTTTASLVPPNWGASQVVLDYGHPAARLTATIAGAWLGLLARTAGLALACACLRRVHAWTMSITGLLGLDNAPLDGTAAAS